jgi:hypothetical protein
LSQRGFDAHGTNHAPASSCFKDGEGAPEEGGSRSVPPQIVGKDVGEKKNGENEGKGYATESPDEAGCLSFRINVAFEHERDSVARVYESVFLMEPTEGLEPPTV